MSKKKKPAPRQDTKLIPKLRFPELEKEGEWEEKKIKNVFTSFSGGTPRTSEKKYYNGDIPFIRSAEIGGDHTELNINQEGLNNSASKLVEKGDLLIALYGANSGDTAICQIDGAINQAILCLRSEYSNAFAYQYLTRLKGWIISKYLQGGQGNLSSEIVNSIQIPFPSKDEQQKIASCLSSLDELISAHSQKLEALKEHKQGLMQALFPREGEKVPKYRFPEFRKDGEWMEKKLGDMYNFLITNSFSRADLNYHHGSVKNIHYGDIHTKFSTLFDITKEDVPFINSAISIKKIKTENYCREGDIIFADASEDLEDIGKSIEIVNLNEAKLISGLHTLLARLISPNLIIGFGGYLFKSSKIRDQIKREAQGAKVKGISATRLSNILLQYPRSKAEQQKIVSCFSSLDELISAQTEKIEQMNQHKKGLMQGLFPMMEDK